MAIFMELAEKNQDSGLLAEALEDVDAAIAVAPDNTNLHYLRARICSDLGDNEGAASGFRIAIQAMRSITQEQLHQSDSSVSTSATKIQSDQYKKDNHQQISADRQNLRNPNDGVRAPASLNRQSGQYDMGDIAKIKTDPLIPAYISTGGDAQTDGNLNEIAALSVEHITMMFRTTSIPSRLVQNILHQLQKILPDDESNRIVYQSMAESKNILDFQRNIDAQLQNDVKGRVIMAVINETLIDECRNSTHKKTRISKTDEDQPAAYESQAQATTTITEKHTEIIRKAFVNCIGPIGNVLVKRHLVKAKNIQLLIAGLESELPDETTRTAFKSAMGKQKFI